MNSAMAAPTVALMAAYLMPTKHWGRAKDPNLQENFDFRGASDLRKPIQFLTQGAKGQNRI